jgi:hypothetical protein
MADAILTNPGVCRHGVPDGRDCGCCDLSPSPGVDAIGDAAEQWARDAETPPKLAALLLALRAEVTRLREFEWMYKELSK